jgi:para-nitrobenzyl esterase
MALTTVQTQYGVLSGVPCGYPDYTVFKGIPYAAPPVSTLRWAPPAEPEKWDCVKVCDKFPTIALQNKRKPGEFYQIEFFPVQEPVSEDCLYMNIWTPAKTEGERLPVMVWIHGGAYINGYGHEPEFDGEAFCKRGVILVTFNYRLGVMGYFAHPQLSERSGYGASGNYGLLDQIQALRWVKENIRTFGGDAGNVTVFGQSAGGGSVMALSVSPLAEGLAQKAIIQSAGGAGGYTLSDAEKFGEFITEHSGLSLDRLRDLPAEDLLTVSAAANESYEGGFKLRFVPCADGYALPGEAGQLMAQGKHWPAPYMAGRVSGDTRLFGEREADWLRFKNGDKPLYVYSFEHEPPGGDGVGAFHSCELWYIFGTLSRCWRPMRGADYELSLRMADYWTNFAKTGDPNGGEWENWPEYTKTSERVLSIY